MKTTKNDLIKISCNSNGNPRYVVHFSELLTNEERQKYRGLDLMQGYYIALNKAKAFGGKAYRAKSYGGGIVFSSYYVQEELDIINKLNGSI